MTEGTTPGNVDLAQQLAALRELAALISKATDVETFSTALCQYLCRVFNAGAASLVLVDPQTDELVFYTGAEDSGALLNRARLKRGEGIAGWVCEHHQSQNIHYARRDKRFCSRVDEITGFYTRNVICAALWRKGQVEGAIEVLNRLDGQPFSDEESALLELVAEQVELLVANVTMITGLQRRNWELSTLIDIDRAVNRIADVDTLIGTILQSAVEVARAEGSSLVLADPDSGELGFFMAVGPAKAKLTDIKIERGQGVVGYCVASGESLYVPRAYEDRRFFQGVDETTGFITKSLMCVPLKTSVGIMGALEVVNLGDAQETSVLQSLLEALASQAAIALERAMLNRKLAQRFDEVDAQLQRTNVTLANEKAKLTAMIEHMADAVIMIDGDGRLLIVNDAAAEMFDLRGILVGRSPLEVESVGLASVLAVGETGAAGTELGLELPQRRTLRVHSATVHSPQGRVGKVVVCSDITELKELAQLRSELVSFVSHELRAPLTSIKGFAAALLDDSRLQLDDHRNFVRIIDHECDRLRRMVADLLCMSRIDSGRALEVQWRRFNLNELVQGVMAAQRVYAPDHNFTGDLPEPGIQLEADADKVEQILTNLLNNAFKYSRRGATTTVRVTGDEQEVSIAVIDQGYGIAPNDIDRLFTQYGRLQDAQRRRITGTGLGLYLTKHLVEAHGGRIEVESEVGRGTTFTVVLPKRRAWGD